VTCPSCREELPGTFAFCPFCGAALGEAPGPSREERKVVSVLFVDLVGFTARSEQLDPEDVRALLDPYHAHVRDELERFGGTVEKFIGDAVVALFGAPVAHEDDPERAVRAALEIRDWVGEQGEELQVRIAVNTGEALVTLGARPAEGEGMAAGDVVNTTARLQAAAPVNGILVGEQTYRATSQAIDYREVEPVVGKGKSEPIPAWEALEARSRLGVDVSRRTDTPLIGRRRELELLVSTLARVREESSPQLVTLVGVPGIGKTRLVRELLEKVGEDVEFVRWRQGRSLPYGNGITFWALAEIVKAELGILENETPAESEQKLRAALAERGSDAAERQWVERQLRPLAGVAEEEQGGSVESVAAWRRFLEILAEEEALVLVFEDLHWADDALLDFVDELVERLSGVPLLVLGTARPELLQRRPGWGGGKPNALAISLSPLSDENTARLMQALLERPVLDAETQEALLARAGGNPLYAEQYARMLVEQGDLEELPETVQGIIAARLDALSEEEKRLLQDAAVVGKVFWLGALAALDGTIGPQAEELLFGLERKELVQRARGSSVAGENEYAFRHLLIRDIAYGQIPRAARSDKHRLAAAWIESLGRGEDQAEMLAHHYLEALELAEATGADVTALGDSARRALRDAGDRAASLYALGAAERFYEAALRLWPESDPERAELLFRRAHPADGWEADPELLAEARDALLAVGDRGRAAEAEILISTSYWMRGQSELSEEYAARAEALIASTPPSRSSAWVLTRLASRASIAGDVDRALALGSEALAQAERLGSETVAGNALGILAMTRAAFGDAAAIEDFGRVIAITTATGQLGTLSRAYNNLSVAHTLLGDLDAAFDARIEAARVAERTGSAGERRWYLGTVTEVRYRRGQWDTALQMAEDFIATVEGGSPHYTAYQSYTIRAEIQLGRGGSAGVTAAAELALAQGREIGDPQVLFYVLASSAHLFSLASADERALPLARELIEALAHGADMQYAVITVPSFASTARRLGLGAELVDALAGHRRTPWTDVAHAYAQADFVAASDLLQRIGSRPDEAEARLQAAQELVAEGRRPEADRQLQRAIELYREMGATHYLRECETLLPASA
jgi:class 3 adenylate cyclase